MTCRATGSFAIILFFWFATSPLLPAAAESPETLVEAAAFGAKGDGVQDNSAAIHAAVQACKNKPHPRLLLQPGVYRIDRTKMTPDHRLFDVRGIDDLTIDGQGATLLFNWGHASPFYFQKCRRLTLRNVKIDWDRVPFSQGKVVAATDNSFDVQVEDNYPVTGNEKVQALMDYDPETRLPLANLDVFGSAIESVKLIAPQQLRIVFKARNLPEKAAHLSKYVKAAVGKLVVLRHEVYGSFAIDMSRCEDVKLENVSIYACPGMGIHAGLSKNIDCDHVEVRIKPGSGRLMSTTADCQYYTFCFGNISLRHGFYEGMGDDGLNVTAKYRAVVKIKGPTSITAALPIARGWPGAFPEPGEHLVFQSGVDMKKRGEATVRSSTWNQTDQMFQIELDRPVEGLAVNDLIASEKYLPKLTVSDSTFQGMRSRALLISTRDATITHCLIRGPGYCGIFLKGGLRHGAEGPSPSNVKIEGCTFEGCGGAAIYGYADGLDRAAGAMNDLEITGNTIRDLPGLAAQRFAKELPGWMHWSAGIALVSATNVKIAGNTFANRPVGIYLHNDDQVTIEGNSAVPPAPAMIDEASCHSIDLTGGNEGIQRQAVNGDIRGDLEYVNDFR